MNRFLEKARRRWSAWRNASVNRSIFSAAVTVGAYTLLAKFCLMLKELVVAYQFGTGDVIDAYIIAYLLPAFAINLGAGALKSVVVPAYVRRRAQQGRDGAHAFLSDVLVIAFAGFALVAAVLALLSEQILPLLASGFDASKLALTRELFVLLLPVVLLSGLGVVAGSVLNAGERFALVAAAPMITPLLTIALLLAAGPRLGIHALVAGAVAGCALELGVLSLRLWRGGFRFSWRPASLPGTAHVVFAQFLPLAGSMLLLSSAELVDQAMAAMLAPGSVAALGYGGKLPAAVTGLGAAALGTAVLPHFSRLVVNGDWPSVRSVLRTYGRLVLFATVPLTLAAVWFSEPIVRILFERGEFGPAATRLVGAVQAMYLLQIPFYILVVMGARLLSAASQNRALVRISVISLVVNIAGNFVLMRYMGVVGIALSTALVQLVSFAVVARHVYRLTGRNGQPPAPEIAL